MATMASMEAGRKPGVVRATLRYDPAALGEADFSRADLVFTGVDLSGPSFETLIFFNNPDADETTPRSWDTGYAASFTIFGYGHCFNGGDTPEMAGMPMTVDKVVVVTDALRRVNAGPSGRLDTVTLVPIAQTPKQDSRGLAPDLLRFESLTLRTYR